jgi:hypothetical protein
MLMMLMVHRSVARVAATQPGAGVAMGDAHPDFASGSIRATPWHAAWRGADVAMRNVPPDAA